MDVEMQIGNTAKIEAVPIKHIDAQDDDDIKSMHVEEKEIHNQQNNIQIEINNKDKILKVEERESHRPINSEAAPFGKSERTRMSEPGDLELVWSDLTITASISEGKCCSKIITQKKILDKVSGRVKSGECLAILGSSGAGKTTLLNYLSRKIESSSLKVEGTVSLNSENISSMEFDSIASYVMQDDILEATMTPTEILMFTAKMKFKLPLEKIEQKVFDMIQDLNLKKCQNTRIGDKITRGVSGGERKRTSIGVELISDPKIIFLDEPTTGLDSYNAYELIQLLKNLSQKNRMIIFTIHQPSSEIYGLLDKINILALGKTIYFGPQKKCFECFDNLKIPVPLKYNPFEHFMEVTNVATIEDPKILSNFPELNSIENKLDRYSSYISNLNGSFERIKNEFFDFTPTVRGFTEETKQNIIDKGIRQNFFYEFGLIFGRNMVISRRNPKVLYMKIAQAIVTALLVSLLFVRLTKDFSGVQDRLGVILNGIIATVLSATTSTVLVLAEENKVFLRERSNNLYSVGAYFMAKIVTEIPVFFVSNCLLGVIVYHSVELNDTYSHKYFSYLGILIYLSFAGSSYAFLLGALVTNPEALIQLNTATVIPLLLLSGFFASADNFAPYLIPFKYISAFKYGFQLLSHIEFNQAPAFNCQNLAPDVCTPLASRFSFLEPFYLSLILIGVMIVVFKLAAFLIIYYCAKIRV